MNRTGTRLWIGMLGMLGMLLSSAVLAADKSPVSFTKIVIDPIFHSEGVAVADKGVFLFLQDRKK
jgi:membrane protein CcdC involved in cytochrome C biogenesis